MREPITATDTIVAYDPEKTRITFAHNSGWPSGKLLVETYSVDGEIKSRGYLHKLSATTAEFRYLTFWERARYAVTAKLKRLWSIVTFKRYRSMRELRNYRYEPKIHQEFDGDLTPPEQEEAGA